MSTPTEVRKQIVSGTTGPLYLLEGDDLQSRHDLSLEFAALVDEGLQAFNVESLYASESGSAAGRDALIGDILSTARTLPMMSPRRVVVVLEAERLLSPRRGKDDDDAQPDLGLAPKKKRSITPVEELEAYFEKPEPMTTLVFVAGGLDGSRRLVKLLRKHADCVNCGSLASTQEAAAWIRKRFEKDELSIDTRALALLIETTGLSLGRIRAEVEKLVLYASGESIITPNHVRDIVLPESESEGVFALMDAVRNGNARLALQEVSALIDAGVQPPMILGQLRAVTIQLKNEARVKNGLEAVLRTDLAIKSSAGTPQYLLECLVVEICSRNM
jgi:DNA polymerase III subunit delta